MGGAGDGLGGWTVTNRVRNCGKKGCASLARWQVVLEFRSPLAPQYPATAFIDLALCDGHKESSTAEDFITDEGWGQICAGLAAAKKAQPRRDLTTVKFRPLSLFVDPTDPKQLGDAGRNL